MLGTVGKVSVRRGAQAWFRGIWSYKVKIVEFQSYFLNKNIKEYFYFSYGGVLGIVGKFSVGRGGWSFFRDIWTYGVRLIEF